MEEVKKDEAKVVELTPDPSKQVRHQLIATLYQDGSYNVSGPLDDGLVFHGLIGLAMEVRNQYGAQQQAAFLRAEAAKRAANPRKEPGMVRKFLDVASGKNRRQREMEQAERLRVAREAREQSEALRAKREMEEATKLAISELRDTYASADEASAHAGELTMKYGQAQVPAVLDAALQRSPRSASGTGA